MALGLDDTTDPDDLLEAGELDDSYNMNIATPSYQQGGKGYASSGVPPQKRQLLQILPCPRSQSVQVQMNGSSVEISNMVD